MSTEKGHVQEADLPKAQLKRLIIAKLQTVDKAKGGDGSRSFQVNKDALLAFSEAAKLFIHYLTDAANENCKNAKRLTISADDVLTALTDLEFGEIVGPLREALEVFRAENREKNKKKAGQSSSSKKRKAAVAGDDNPSPLGAEEATAQAAPALPASAAEENT